MDKIQKNIIIQTAEKLNLNVEQVEELYLLYFKFVKETMEKGVHNDKNSFLNVRIPNFGMFCFNEKKYKKMQNNFRNKFYSQLKKQANESTSSDNSEI